jgi:hypothetical protein
MRSEASGQKFVNFKHLPPSIISSFHNSKHNLNIQMQNASVSTFLQKKRPYLANSSVMKEFTVRAHTTVGTVFCKGNQKFVSYTIYICTSTKSVQTVEYNKVLCVFQPFSI